MNIIYVGFPSLGFQVKKSLHNVCICHCIFSVLFWISICSRYCTRLEFTPILLARSCLLFFGSLLFLVERIFIAFLWIPGWGISRFYFYGFYLLPAAFTFWAFSSFFPRDKVQPYKQIILMPGLGEWDRWAADKMKKWWYDGGRRWLFQKSPRWQTKTYGYRLTRTPRQSPQPWSSGLM